MKSNLLVIGLLVVLIAGCSGKVALKEELPREMWEVQVQQFYGMDRADGLKIWVIRGTITNRFTKTKNSILVRGTIQDGEEFIVAQSYVGNNLPNASLYSLSLDQIQETLMNRHPQDENNDPFFLMTDQRSEFVIVFDNVTSEKPILPDLPVQVIESETLE